MPNKHAGGLGRGCWGEGQVPAPQQLPSTAGAGHPGTICPARALPLPGDAVPAAAGALVSCWRRDSSSLKSPCKGHRVPVGPAALFAAPRPSAPAFLGSSTPGSRGCDLAASRSLPLIYMFFLSSRSRSTNFDSPLPQRPARLRRGYPEPSLYHRTRLTRGSAPPQVTAEHEASRWEQHSPSSKPQQPPSSSGRGTASPQTQQGPAHTCTPGVLALRPSFDARQHRPTRQLPPPQLTLLTLLPSCQGPGEVP